MGELIVNRPLQGKVALVAGATRGAGPGLARNRSGLSLAAMQRAAVLGLRRLAGATGPPSRSAFAYYILAPCGRPKRHAGAGDLPETGDKSADVLPLEEEICGHGGGGAARLTAAGGRE
jgi:hypothetical protein